MQEWQNVASKTGQNMTDDEIKRWYESNVVLGGSWYRSADHETLGKGADFETIAQTMQKMKVVMIERSITIDHLHDFLQSHVTSFDMLFHEFLRFERSQELLKNVIDEIIADADFLPSPGAANVVEFKTA